MSRISSLAVASVAGVAFVASTTLAASAHHGPDRTSAKPATMSFTAKQTGTVVQGRKDFAISDTDVRGAQKIGADVLSCHERSSASVCSVAFATKGGLIYAHLRLSDQTGAVTGKVTGGTGRNLHAAGTVSGQAVSHSAVKITLTYRK